MTIVRIVGPDFIGVLAPGVFVPAFLVALGIDKGMPLGMILYWAKKLGLRAEVAEAV
jgi:hypothetical protein